MVTNWACRARAAVAAARGTTSEVSALQAWIELTEGGEEKNELELMTEAVLPPK
jgi:hypothetical protein